MRSFRFVRSLLMLHGWVLIALVLAGCGDSGTGSVSGKVTYKGEPVTKGTVQFFAPEKGVGASGQLDSSGAYSLAAPIAAGKYKVYIQPPTPELLPPGTPPRPVTFNVPQQYRDANSTPVTKEVKPGKNDIPLDLGS